MNFDMRIQGRLEGDWRVDAGEFAENLHQVHAAVADAGEALENDDVVTARALARSALEDIRSLAASIKSLREGCWPAARSERRDEEGAHLIIGAAAVATVALDVLLNASLALAKGDDAHADLLIGACIDAEAVFLDCSSVLQGVLKATGPELLTLRDEFETEDRASLRRKVIRGHRIVLERCGHPVTHHVRHRPQESTEIGL